MGVTIHCGDVFNVLRTLPDESVHCCVTSPPYWGLRDYGVDGQIGLEPTPDEYVAKMVNVFREVRRVLRKDGALWLNLGDSYAGSGKGGNPPESEHQKQATNRGSLVGQTARDAARTMLAGMDRCCGLKPKDLVGIPWRVAFALQADGWYLRQDTIWHKPNPMPESVTDRCTKAHEYIFLLSKSARYYYDADATREPASESTNGKTWEERKAVGFRGDTKHPTKDAIESGMAIPSFATNPAGRNRRSVWTVDEDEYRQFLRWKAEHARDKSDVWTVSTQPYKGAHFATFPPKLIEPCILAGCPAGGTVLDPFGGSGTTGEVAAKHGRNAVLIELNPEYVELAQQRVGLFAAIGAESA